MAAAELFALIAGVLLTLIAIAYFVFARKHPENADRHVDYDNTDADASGRGTLPGRVQERPAGPDAESQAPEPGNRIETEPPDRHA
jgi:hypothetical protein